MFPLRCTVACEIFSKSSMGNPIENVFIGEMVFPPGLQLAESFPSGKEIFLAPMFSLRCIVAFEFFSKSQRTSPKETFSRLHSV